MKTKNFAKVIDARLRKDPKIRKAVKGEHFIIEVCFTILREMERQKITQSVLAERLGITRGRMSQILSGKNLRLSTVSHIFNALGRTVVIQHKPCQYLQKSK